MREQPIFHALLSALTQGFSDGSAVPVDLQTSIQHTIPLDLSDDLPTLLYPPNRLIYSPRTIEPTLRQPFLDGTKEVILVCVQSGNTFRATLQALHSNHLIAHTQQAVSQRKYGETVLVVFPMTTSQQYVLQTSIYNVEAGRWNLTYLDPRYEVRHHIPLTAPVILQPVQTSLITALRQQEGHIIRQITLTLRKAQGTASSVIADLFCPIDADEPLIPPCEAGPSMTCALRDISLGGVCLTVNATRTTNALLHQLVRLTIPLPHPTQALADWTSVSLTLQLLGSVRGVSGLSSGKALHIYFLKRFMPEVDTLFEHLAHSAPTPSYPIF